MGTSSLTDYHEPVLSKEVLEAFDLKAHLKAKIIDATLGTGGHTLEILNSDSQVLSIDWDKEMLEVAKERFKACPSAFKSLESGQLKLAYGNFKDIDKIAQTNGFEHVDGVLFDLGVSNLQLTSKERGFSFSNPKAALDMRIDPENQKVTAADLLNILNEKQLRDLFGKVLTYPESAKIAKRIIQKRTVEVIANVEDVLEILAGERIKPGLHFSTLPFLALRIAVNSELENLQEVLPKAFGLLKVGGRLVIITFHSGEDRIVKDYFREQEKEGAAKQINKKPITASDEEIRNNNKSRSAKLRILEKI